MKIPVDILNPGGIGANIANIQTNFVNGMSFSLSKELDTYGLDTLILRAAGSPRQEGTYTYTFTTNGSIKTTCSFSVTTWSDLGSYENPACNCLAIYEERPIAPNGEYWLQICSATDPTPTRTYCDIVGGGWTLVWSYSENTCRNTYAPTGNMSLNNTWRTNLNVPRNRITTAAPAGTGDGPTDYRINYNDFRLNHAEWEGLVGSGDLTRMKCHITNNPNDMKDEWALNNYMIITPISRATNPLFIGNNDDMRPPVVGKYFGKNWGIRTNYTDAWTEVNSTRFVARIWNASYMTHWDFGNRGSNVLFDVVPNPGGMTGTNNQIAFSHANNLYSILYEDYNPNHHIGKCTSDDYSFATKWCGLGDLRPHSFNGGEGRYVQWFTR